MRRSRPPMPASKHWRVARPKPALPGRAAFLTTCVTYCLAEHKAGRGSVPPVRPGSQLPSRPTAPQSTLGQPYAQGALGESPQGPSFLGTAAATAAGMVGGALLLDGVR